MSKIDGKTAKKSIVKYLSHVNTLVSKVKNFANNNSDGLTEGTRNKADRFKDDLKQQLKRMETRWDECTHLEVGEVTLYNDLELKIEEARQLTEEAEDALFALMDKPKLEANSEAKRDKEISDAVKAAIEATMYIWAGLAELAGLGPT